MPRTKKEYQIPGIGEFVEKPFSRKVPGIVMLYLSKYAVDPQDLNCKKFGLDVSLQTFEIEISSKKRFIFQLGADNMVKRTVLLFFQAKKVSAAQKRDKSLKKS